VIKLSKNGSEKAYALAAADALTQIKAGKNSCHFEDLLPSWKRLINTAYYHDKHASVLLKEHLERKGKKAPTRTHSKKTDPSPTPPKQPTHQVTLMEHRLRELGLIREK
jgi:DNA-binding SARP family transcriptional activator